MRCLGLMAFLVFSGAPPALAQSTVPPPRADCTESAHLMATGCPTIELSGAYFEGVWDFHGHAPDRLTGGTAAVSFTIREGWGVVFELLGARVLQQQPSNAWLAGLSILFRKRFAERRRLAFFVDGGLGASYATVVVPDRGTQFNYLVQAGTGVTHRLGPRVSGILALRFLHLSNLSLNGPDHNPDIQALGGHVGIVLSLGAAR